MNVPVVGGCLVCEAPFTRLRIIFRMRSRASLLRPRHHLPLSFDTRQALTFSSASPRRFPRSVGSSSRFSENLRTQQLSSSASTPPEEDDTPPVVEPVIETAIVEEKPKRRSSRASSKTAAANVEKEQQADTGVQRAGVEAILWQPHDIPPSLTTSATPGGDPNPSPNVNENALPEPWLLQDAYETLLLALHPQTQHRATYPSSAGSAVEPTLGFYCPLEGGDYVVDATVRNLAKRAKADVVVIDALELSAGEHGRYGKGTTNLV